MINKWTRLSLGVIGLCAIQGPVWAVNDGLGLPDPVVYATGTYHPNGEYYDAEAVMWVDDFAVATPLTNTPDALAQTAGFPVGSSIALRGSDVYVAGRRVDASGAYVATVWKNGAVYATYPGLPSPSGASSAANSITFNGLNMYVVGGRVGDVVGAIWKNGVATDLTGWSYPRSIAVTGTFTPTTYVVGESQGAYLWQNNIRYQLYPSGTGTHVKISGGKAYVSGQIGTNGVAQAAYWTFDTTTHSVQTHMLTDGGRWAHATAIAVSGSNVYVAGAEDDGTGYPVAKLWINGVPQVLGGGAGEYGYANSIFVLGSDVYVGGSLAERPAIWKNGALYRYDETVYGHVSSIYVKQGL